MNDFLEFLGFMLLFCILATMVFFLGFANGSDMAREQIIQEGVKKGCMKYEESTGEPHWIPPTTISENNQ